MPASANEFWLASPQAMRWHFMQSTDGAITRAILNRTGTGAGMQFFLGIEQLANPVTGWVNEPWVALCKGSGNGVAIAMNSPIICSGYWLAKPAAAYISGVACTEGVSGNVLCAPGFSAGQVANEIDGSWFMLPVAWYGQSVGSRGRHGTLVDFWIGSEAVPYGDTYPNDATYQFAQFGCVIVKWNGVIPQL
jgi:hypothetical protein